MPVLKFKLKPYQHKFYESKKRFPAIISAIGTGKTMVMLFKIAKFCEDYPNSLALIVRKEFTDLKDSTIKDFETYFGVRVPNDKDYRFANGSVIMFRHGAELGQANLKNINLSIAGIEQAEEFEDNNTFVFIRDRLRRQNAPYRQLCVIANANGHNWLWKLWKNNPTSDEYILSEATTFDNADNLPADFIKDLKQMEIDAPNHYRRYVMNSHEDTEQDDTLFTFQKLQECAKLELSRVGVARSILSVDVSRYGSNETVFTIIESRGVLKWEQTHLEVWKPGQFVENRLMQIVGKIADFKHTLRPDIIVIDDDGMGGGVVDRLGELKIDCIPFRGGEKPNKHELYGNKRTEAAFELKELVDRQYIKLAEDSEQVDQLMTLRFLYRSDKTKMLITKEKMRKDGIKSPDRADALLMAASCCHIAFTYNPKDSGLPRIAIMDDPFKTPTEQGFAHLQRNAQESTVV